MKILFNQLLLACIVSTTLLTGHGIAHADYNGEIDHLLVFIAQSDCTYIRNGKEYSALEARDHIAGKYDHIKRRIRNAETFIHKVASHSSITGKPYLIRCGEVEQTTEKWLFRELTTYRNQSQ